MELESVIGLEVHAQLLTKSKMFCLCDAHYQTAEPNSKVCPVCMALPGSLPVINQQAIEFVIMTGLALNCSINEYTRFDRKNYVYPDLVKGYQISQFDFPVAHHGFLEIQSDNQSIKIGITQAHLEEDVAKLQHINNSNNKHTLIDLNRCGVPLMEIVSEPELSSPDQARSYLIKLQNIVRYLKVSTGDMEEGSFRCDANISMRPKGSKSLGTKVEIKNMNSFRSIHKALTFEINRQTTALNNNEKIIQETRGWNEEKEITFSQRSKEFAHDYRYFPEPDLKPVKITKEHIQKLKSLLPEMPEDRHKRLISSYNLSEYQAGIITSNKATADYFEACLHAHDSENSNQFAIAKSIANWITTELAKLLNHTNTSIENNLISPKSLVDLLNLIEKGTLNATQGKQVLEMMFNTGNPPDEIVAAENLAQINDLDSIQSIVKNVINQHPTPVRDYLNGKENVIGYLVGQVMKSSKGKADPKISKSLLIKEIESLKK
jgi:aspartyl-tRNA(Asn)/glutamyl-tRNA(Gln) amidotransferase subunit B